MAADDKTQIVKAPDPVAVGTQLSGTYELDQRIASGGMGEVYRGHNIQTGDPVAIKIVLPEFARDQTILSLFKKEASILNHLFHEAIVRYHVFSIDKEINRPYLAMEFVDGMSLVDMFARGPMDPEEARRLLVRLASGLAVAHEAGVIHRDLSPDNIVLPGGKVERAKIIDFGIARSASVGGETLLGGSFAGKYNFVSPEQLGMAGGEVTERSDIYSLGLVLAAVLRGKTIDMTGTQVDIIEKRRVVPDLSGIDSRMRPVLEAMLQPDPKNRPSSMMEIVEGLREQEPARVRSVWEETAPPKAPPPPAATPAIPTGMEADAAQLGDGWPPATSRTPAPWRTPDTPPPTGPVALPGATSAMGMAPPAENGTPARRSGIGLGLMLVAGLAAAGGGGAYVGGYFDALLPRTVTVPPEPTEPQPGPLPADPPSPGNVPGPETAQPEPEKPADGQPATPASPQPGQPEPEPADAQPPAPQPPVNQPPAGEPDGQDEPPQTQPPAVDEPPQPQPEPEAEPQPEPEPESANPPAPGPVEAEADPRLAWLKSYSGGECFFASALDWSGGKLRIEGFGSTVTPFEAMLEAFKSAFPTDPEPDIGVRLIAPKQCPATAFMAHLRDAAVSPPRLDLAKDVLFSGDPMAGGLALDPVRTTYLLLVDHDGIAHNLEGILKRSGDGATFSVQLGLGAGEGIGKSPLPQMLVAFSTSSPLAAMNMAQPVPAGELFPAIEGELRNRGINAAAATRYFRIRG